MTQIGVEVRKAHYPGIWHRSLGLRYDDDCRVGASEVPGADSLGSSIHNFKEPWIGTPFYLENDAPSIWSLN